MKASVVDLRYKMKDILNALARKESVQVFHYGKIKGTIVPSTTNKKIVSAKDHEFFGFLRNNSISVEDKMKQLRSGRYNDL